jgi:hypothetical protein
MASKHHRRLWLELLLGLLVVLGGWYLTCYLSEPEPTISDITTELLSGLPSELQQRIGRQSTILLTNEPDLVQNADAWRTSLQRLIERNITQ